MRRHCALIFLTFLAIACVHAENTADIRDTPGGKRLLFVDGDDIRPAPGGKRLLFIDGGDTIRPEPGGKRLLFIDGDSVRPAPGGIRLLFIDGDTLRRTPNSDRLLFIDGDDIRPAPGGKRLLFIDGKISRAQLIAVLYYLKPELFQLSAQEEAALKKGMADAQAEVEANAKKDPFAGNWSILSFSSTDGRKAGGKLVVTKKGAFYRLDFANSKTNEAMEGVGVFRKINGDNELWCVIGPQASTALAVYEADDKGVLTGTWAPCYLLDEPASFGSEVLTPSGKSTYTVSNGKAPKTGAPYAGLFEAKPVRESINGDGEAFDAVWSFGDIKVNGVGFRRKNSVGIAGSTGKVYDVVRFKLDNGSMAGDLRSNTGATGFYTFGKD